MKRKMILGIIIFLIIIISVILLYPKEEKKILDTNKKESNNNFISMMLENDVGSNKFIENADLKFPLEGYHFNNEKSGCENGGTLTWNSEKQKIEASLITSDKCYAYFDNVQVKSEFEYTGDYEEYIVPSTGTYKIELWGASGGDADSYKGGNGAYASGNINLKKGEKLYVYVGSQGKTAMNTTIDDSYNGGGSANTKSNSDIAGSGGGATDIRLEKGDWNIFSSLKSRIMVAAGGGGAYYYVLYNGNGGPGGTLKGINVEYSTCGNNRDFFGGTVASQNKPATFNSCGPNLLNYESFFCSCNKYTDWYSGGGGGYYGGGSGFATGASGGSSFISGYPGCDTIDEKSTEDAIIHTNQPNHYSGKVFTDSEMIAGNSTMPSPDGGTEDGHTGNGYARITLIK